MELYRKHRPSTLEDLAGNEVVKKKLSSMKPLPHSFLITGPSGTGKTTIGRIIKNMVKCDDFDYMEIDSVDLSGVDTVRDLRRKLKYAPSKGEARVFLIDEIHRLSSQGADCLLKGLEECPSHVYFILCTTNPEKLPKTLKNRCCCLETETLSPDVVAKKVLWPICKKEGLNVPKDVLLRIGKTSGGSSRMAVNILETVKDLPEDEMMEAAEKSLDEEQQCVELCRAMMKGKSVRECMSIVKNLSVDPESARRMILGYLSSVLQNKCDEQTYFMMRCFEDNYYDTGKAGLIMNVYEAMAKE